MASSDDVGTSQVTISLLPTTLGLIRIPRPRLAELAHPLLKQVLQPDPVFLNVTANEIELSIFAEHSALADFEPIAREDRQRSRKRRSTATASELDVVEVSYEHWNVLQIDSHASSAENSGARVREISAPLAAAGISILYQSSYMSDFLLVKASRLQAALSLFASAGLYLHSSDPEHLTSTFSPLAYSSPAGEDEAPMHDFAHEGAVLTRSRSSTDASRRSSIFCLPSPVLETPSEGFPSEGLNSDLGLRDHILDAKSSPKPRKKSLSPAAVSVDILTPDLACVGLADNSVDQWSLNMVKLVAFPELIPPSPLRLPLPPPSRPSKVIHGFNAEVNIRLDELRRVRGAKPALVPLSMDVDTAASAISPLTESYSPLSSGDDEAYYSTSPYSVSTPSLLSESESKSSRSYPDLDCLRSKSRRSSTHLYNTGYGQPPHGQDLPLSETPRPPESLSASQRLTREQRPSEAEDLVRPFNRHAHATVGCVSPPAVPFFSFTRTREGSSLTTDVAVLAALFPPSERHMVLCGDELDATDRLAAAVASGTSRSSVVLSSSASVLDFGLGVSLGEADTPTDDEKVDWEMEAGVEETFKCLQVDLQRFGLEKHGLVNRFSQVLDENGINHMYSSTFKTANLLVERADARRARSLLRSC